MNWNDYIAEFDRVLEGKSANQIYNDTTFVEYVKLNVTRMKRWAKRGELIEELKNKLDELQDNQQWVLITEPWCGDAAHIAPFISKIAEYSPKIDLNIQLRDSDDSEIDNYLTNGSKSIPKLIVRNADGEDLFVWGARPIGATELVQKQKAQEGTKEEKKAELQMWYNSDKGLSIQQELLELI